MEIDFASWPDGVTVKNFVETGEALELSSDMNRFDHDVNVTLTVNKTDDEAIVEGRVATRAKATCVRCLDEFDVDVGEEFRRIGKVVAADQVGDDTGDPDYVFLPRREPVWNLNEQVREVILLAVSENPLCGENCLGLCPRCGHNLNVGECGCDRGRGEGSLAQLRDLLKQRPSRIR